MPFSAARRLVLLFVCCVPPAAEGDAFAPLPTYNQSPLAQIYGLPAPHGARLLAHGERRVQVALEAANHFVTAGTAAERLALDGETHRTVVAVRYGAAGAEWGIEIPYLTHSGGFLDGFIDGWHDFFGLPDGGRPAVPRDRLHYVYARNGTEQLRLTDAARGVGDLRLLAAWPIASDAAVIALRTSLKLPTGDAARLLGSGAVDFAVWFAAACRAERCGETWRWHASAGALALGRGEVLADQQRRTALFGATGVGWRVVTPLVLKAELRAHTAFYGNSDLTPLSGAALQLILGGTWIAFKGTAIDLAISEDLRVTAAPDVSLLLGLSARF